MLINSKFLNKTQRYVNVRPRTVLNAHWKGKLKYVLNVMRDSFSMGLKRLVQLVMQVAKLALDPQAMNVPLVNP